MEETLETTLLEYGKSAFLIDLVVHNSGQKYIRILQTIQDEESVRNRAIKINPSLLSDFVRVLNSYSTLLNSGKPIKSIFSKKASVTIRSRNLSDQQKEAIQIRYLKGVSIADLTIQFDCKKELIEQVLRNQGIAIVDNKPPKWRNYKGWKKRKN